MTDIVKEIWDEHARLYEVDDMGEWPDRDQAAGLDRMELICDQDRWWRTADDRVILVADMESGHRDNLIGFLERNFDAARCRGMAALERMLLTCNGEMAEWAIETELARVEDLVLAEQPLYRRLLALRAEEIAAVTVMPSGAEVVDMAEEDAL